MSQAANDKDYFVHCTNGEYLTRSHTDQHIRLPIYAAYEVFGFSEIRNEKGYLTDYRFDGTIAGCKTTLEKERRN